MMLYKDDLVMLDYAAAQDVLVAQLTGQDQFTAPDLKHVFASIIGCISEHAIGNLLVDFGKSIVTVTDKDYKALMSMLAVGLMRSTVKKVARVAPQDFTREQKVEIVYSEIKKAVNLSLKFRNFTSRASALNWLTEK